MGDTGDPQPARGGSMRRGKGTRGQRRESRQKRDLTPIGVLPYWLGPWDGAGQLTGSRDDLGNIGRRWRRGKSRAQDPAGTTDGMNNPH